MGFTFVQPNLPGYYPQAIDTTISHIGFRCELR